MKNQNKIIAVVFFAIAALMSAMEFLYVADRYPIGFFSALLAFEILLTFTASAVFIVGTAIKSRTVLITAEGIFAGAAGISLISAVMRSGAMLRISFIWDHGSCRFPVPILMSHISRTNTAMW